MMKRAFITILFAVITFASYGQVVERLSEMGMEDIRCVESDGETYVSFENSRYRGSYTGVGEAIKAMLGGDIEGALNMVVTVSDTPELSISISAELIAGYKSGRVSLSQLYEAMTISKDVDPIWSKVRSVKQVNSSTFKADFVVYPELMLDNSRYASLYSYYFNLSPALEMELWRGAHFTAQTRIPVVTNLTGKYSKVRLGVLSVTQEFYLGNGFQFRLDAGNFTNERLGVEGELVWSMSNGRFAFSALAGQTVQSTTLDDGTWYISRQSRSNMGVAASAYEPKFNLQFDLQVNKYLYGDVGVRADCTRHFGEYAIGAYAIYTSGETNCGFSLAIPLGGKRYMKNNGVRIRQADYFPLEYSMRSWGNYADENMAESYNVVPNENKSSNMYQPDYIRYFLLKTIEKENKSNK